MIRRCVKMVAALSIIAIMLVGCGKAEQTGITNETGAMESTMTENTAVAENETEAVTPTPTETPTEAPTPEPTEEPTPTPEPVHEHSYIETIIKEGTCQSWGTKLYTCSCGHSYEKEYCLDCVSDGNRVVGRQPDCTVEGVSAEHCMYCGMSMYGTAIPATGHVPYSYWVYWTHTGDYVNYCSICNASVSSSTTRPEGVEIRECTPIDSSTLQPIN